jgi:hypothetical protein
MSFPEARRLTPEQAANRILWVLSRRPILGRTITFTALMERTNMRQAQVRSGERYLKQYLFENPDEANGWVLHISLGSVSEHGLIQDGDRSLVDALARISYMSSRATSELAYREQQIARIGDRVLRRRLTAGITYQRAAEQAFADALDRLDGSD